MMKLSLNDINKKSEIHYCFGIYNNSIYRVWSYNFYKFNGIFCLLKIRVIMAFFYLKFLYVILEERRKYIQLIEYLKYIMILQTENCVWRRI